MRRWRWWIMTYSLCTFSARHRSQVEASGWVLFHRCLTGCSFSSTFFSLKCLSFSFSLSSVGSQATFLMFYLHLHRDISCRVAFSPLPVCQRSVSHHSVKFHDTHTLSLTPSAPIWGGNYFLLWHQTLQDVFCLPARNNQALKRGQFPLCLL